MTISPKEMDQDDDYHPRNMVYSKIEKIVQEMQDEETGVPVKCHKLFLTTIPAVFTGYNLVDAGYDLVEWLMERLQIEESTELLHLASLLCQFGYFFPVADNKSLTVKDDGSLYRFQSPYFWPSQNWESDSVDYAIYLAKRTMRNKQRHGLEDHEQVAFTKLKKLLCDKWDFVFMQAEEQVRLGKERKKADKAVFDSQERAFWRVHRPGSGPTLHSQQEICRQYNPRRSFLHNKATIEAYVKEITFYKVCLGHTKMKVSKVVESLIHHCQQYEELDPFLFPALPSNPWISDDVSMWMLNTVLADTPTERRVKRWSFSLEELLADATGRHEFQMFLEKEYSSENLHFWNAVEELKGLPHSQVPGRVHSIYQEYLGPGALHEINIDGKTMEETVEAMKSPSRFTFDKAQAHIFLLMKKDSYQRFLRSSEYKGLLANAVIPSTKKKFFAFGTKKKSPNPSPKSKRRGSASSMMNTDHCLAANTLTQHSYSTGNLQELENTRSSKSSPSECTTEEQKTSNHRSLSPSSFMKKLNDLVRSETTQRSNLAVPPHPSQLTADTHPSGSDDAGGGSSESDEPAGSSLGLNITVPNTKHNVVAPWEEEEDI